MTEARMDTRHVVIGIDIGGTTTSLGFVDRHGNVLAEATLATGRERAQDLVVRVVDAIFGLQRQLPQDFKLMGIGIGVPNANHTKGTVEYPVNLAWDEITDLAGLMRGHFQLPVAVTNDANAAAVGEMLFGAAQGLRDFIVITLGTGLGSGLVVNGQMVYGADGSAGELGHTVVDPEGRACACGKRGCLETYASASGICRTVLALLAERREPSPLRQLSADQLTSKGIADAALDGDVIALEAFERTGRILGMKLADAVAHTLPEAIFLFGGLAKAGDLILRPTRTHLEAFLFPPYRGRVQVLPSAVDQGSSAVLGAAALIWNELT
jgi:glucokinase